MGLSRRRRCQDRSAGAAASNRAKRGGPVEGGSGARGAAMNDASRDLHPNPETHSFDVARVRPDFPILNRSINGMPLVYLDSAASAQRPLAVLRAIEHYETHS